MATALMPNYLKSSGESDFRGGGDDDFKGLKMGSVATDTGGNLQNDVRGCLTTKVIIRDMPQPSS